MEKLSLSQEEKDRMNMLNSILYESTLFNQWFTAKEFLYRIVRREGFFLRRGHGGTKYYSSAEFQSPEYIYRQLLALVLMDRPHRASLGQFVGLDDKPFPITATGLRLDEDGNIKTCESSESAYGANIDAIKGNLLKSVYDDVAVDKICFNFKSNADKPKPIEYPSNGRPVILNVLNKMASVQSVRLFNDMSIPEGVDVHYGLTGLSFDDICGHIKVAGMDISRIRVDLTSTSTPLVMFDDGESFFFEVIKKTIGGTVYTAPIELVKSRAQFIGSAIEAPCDLRLDHLSALSFDMPANSSIRISLFQKKESVSAREIKNNLVD